MPVLHELQAGPFPTNDGWRWIYRAFDQLAPPDSLRRSFVCRYFFPGELEGRTYRWLGVHLFGALVPTGGVVVRRMTGARMAAYTLKGTSLGAARAFYYRACVFEALHLPFLVTLVVLALHRWSVGRPDLALENTVINLLVNVYPMLHHRRTRLRIVHLLTRPSSSDRARRS